MKQRLVYRRRIPDSQYALFLFNRAQSFWPGRELLERSGLNIFYHHVAISIELSLKSYLTQAGISEAWQMKRIRHDLGIAYRCAKAFGLNAPAATEEVLDLIHPHFMKGGFHHEFRDWPRDKIGDVHDVIGGLQGQALYFIDCMRPENRLAQFGQRVAFAVENMFIRMEDLRFRASQAMRFPADWTEEQHRVVLNAQSSRLLD